MIHSPASFLWLILSLLVWGSPAEAQAETGPFKAKWRDVHFEDSEFGRGKIIGRIYVPTMQTEIKGSPATEIKPSPLIGFMHGWRAKYQYYDSLALHLASWGFVVASIGTQTGQNGNHFAEAKDTKSLMHWVASQSKNPGSWLNGKVAEGDWGASGHSMGGGACIELIKLEPKVQVIAPLQPWLNPKWSKAAFKALEKWAGSAWFVAGKLDNTCPTEMVRNGFDTAKSTSRRFFTEFSYLGHLGPINGPPSHPKLSSAQKLSVHQQILSQFFRAELLGQEDQYQFLFGPLANEAELVQINSCRVPIIWVEKNTLHVVAKAKETLKVFGETHTADALGKLILPIPAAHSGSIQVTAGKSKSRIITLP